MSNDQFVKSQWRSTTSHVVMARPTTVSFSLKTSGETRPLPPTTTRRTSAPLQGTPQSGECPPCGCRSPGTLSPASGLRATPAPEADGGQATRPRTRPDSGEVMAGTPGAAPFLRGNPWRGGWISVVLPLKLPGSRTVSSDGVQPTCKWLLHLCPPHIVCGVVRRQSRPLHRPQRTGRLNIGVTARTPEAARVGSRNEGVPCESGWPD
jgi:hypothetical protein